MSRQRKYTPPQMRCPTQTQAEQAAIDKARQWALDDSAGLRPACGEIPCPKCGDRLSYQITSGGKVHGCCAIANCIWWVDA